MLKRCFQETSRTSVQRTASKFGASRIAPELASKLATRALAGSSKRTCLDLASITLVKVLPLNVKCQEMDTNHCKCLCRPTFFPKTASKLIQSPSHEERFTSYAARELLWLTNKHLGSMWSWIWKIRPISNKCVTNSTVNASLHAFFCSIFVFAREPTLAHHTISHFSVVRL